MLGMFFKRLEGDMLYFFSGSGLKSKDNMCFQTDLHTNRQKGECQTAFRVCGGIRSVCESQKQQGRSGKFSWRVRRNRDPSLQRYAEIKSRLAFSAALE